MTKRKINALEISKLNKQAKKSITLYIDEDQLTPKINSGETSDRPDNLTEADEGYQYFDKTLKKYICWIWDDNTSSGDWYNLDGTALT